MTAGEPVSLRSIEAWRAESGLFNLLPPVSLDARAAKGPVKVERRAGVETAPSNDAFDADLKARNPEWGLRALEDLADEAARHGLMLDRVVEMPANNISAVFRKGGAR